MSSESFNQPIQPSDLQMINRILARAGYRGSIAEVDASATTGAAHFLLELFHQGTVAEADLTIALEQRGQAQMPGDDTPKQVKEQALDRWQDEGGG